MKTIKTILGTAMLVLAFTSISLYGKNQYSADEVTLAGYVVIFIMSSVASILLFSSVNRSENYERIAANIKGYVLHETTVGDVNVKLYSTHEVVEKNGDEIVYVCHNRSYDEAKQFYNDIVDML